MCLDLDLDSARHAATVGPNGFKPETTDCFGGGDGKTTANDRGGERFTASWQMAKSTRAEESLCFCSSNDINALVRQVLLQKMSAMQCGVRWTPLSLQALATFNFHARI